MSDAEAASGGADCPCCMVDDEDTKRPKFSFDSAKRLTTGGVQLSNSIESEHQRKVAFITGGGRGFGKAFGNALAVLADIDLAATEEAAIELRKNGAEILPLACNVADEAQVAEVIARTVEALGGIDILINNAGCARSLTICLWPHWVLPGCGNYSTSVLWAR